MDRDGGDGAELLFMAYVYNLTRSSNSKSEFQQGDAT